MKSNLKKIYFQPFFTALFFYPKTYIYPIMLFDPQLWGQITLADDSDHIQVNLK